MKARRRSDVLVGVVVLLGIALIVSGVIWMQGYGFGREETVVLARFDEVGQLLEGNSVKLRGVPIGRVDDIALAEDGGGVVIRMRIDGSVALPQDPVVVLSPESMFGDWQAEIVPRQAFPEYDYAEAPDPAVLPGYSLPDISRLTAVADQIAQNMAELSARFELAFTEETADNVRLAIENIQEVSERLTGLVGGQQRAIDEVATNLQQATQTLEDAAQTVQRAFAQVETALGEDRLVRVLENVERTTARTDTLTESLLAMSVELRRAATSADSILQVIAAVSTDVQQGEGTLGRLARDTMLYVGLRESSIELQALLRDIRENPRKYITIRVF